MGTIDSMTSVLTQYALDALCEKFHIPDVVHPELPGRNDMIHNSHAGNFRRCYINSKNKGWMSFSKRAENALVCYTRPLNSLKNWNDHFFWVDASAFPLVVLWHNNKPLRKDPHPTPAEFNANVFNYLADNPASFRKFLEPFLCFVGISRYYDLDENCYPTFWANDDQEMDLFAFINHADPTKSNVNVHGAGTDDMNEEGDVTPENEA
nr:putative transposase (putative), gypsy type [Tanacetum cinerariifolium]